MIEKAVDTPARLAFFGGSFDPVHCAHLEVARCALRQFEVDRVVFVPASKSPFKQKPRARAADRLQMLRLVLQGEAGLELDTFEIDRHDAVSFTIDTVTYFRKLYDEAELFWIIGEDQLAHLDKWFRIDELLKMVIFLVYPRPGSLRISKDSMDGLNYHLLKAKTMAISSTEVRERCAKGLSVRDMVPNAVEAYISQRGLYKKGNIV